MAQLDEEHVRSCVHGGVAHSFTVLQEVKLLFHSYVGAVYAQQGMTVVQNWIGALIDPDYVPTQSPDVDMDPLHNTKKFKAEQFVPAAMSATPEPPVTPMPPMHPMPPQPPPPSNPPPPLPSFPNPLSPAQPNTAFLPLFNQTANQRRMFVEYPAQFSGPAHAGKWTVKCVGEQPSTIFFSSRSRITHGHSQRHRERNRFRRQQAARQRGSCKAGLLRHGLGSAYVLTTLLFRSSGIDSDVGA